MHETLLEKDVYVLESNLGYDVKIGGVWKKVIKESDINNFDLKGTATKLLTNDPRDNFLALGLIMYSWFS